MKASALIGIAVAAGVTGGGKSTVEAPPKPFKPLKPGRKNPKIRNHLKLNQ